MRLGFLMSRGWPALHYSRRQRPSLHAHAPQTLEYFGRHSGWQPDKSVILLDIDAVDLRAIQVGLVRERADNVPRLNAMRATDLETIGLLRTEARALAAAVARPLAPLRQCGRRGRGLFSAF